MPLKLTERSRVKDLLGVARADSLYDLVLSGLIELSSDEAQRFCRRKFSRAARVEYYRSYDQAAADPTPQYIWLDGPVDTNETFGISWALGMQHSTNGQVLTADQYTLDAEEGLVTVKGNWGLANPLVIYPYHWGSYGYDPTGFRVTYTGGYTTTENENTGSPDPMDDYGVTLVPEGLRQIVAQKIAEDWRGTEGMPKISVPWTEEQKVRLKPWAKKDIL